MDPVAAWLLRAEEFQMCWAEEEEEEEDVMPAQSRAFTRQEKPWVLALVFWDYG